MQHATPILLVLLGCGSGALGDKSEGPAATEPDPSETTPTKPTTGPTELPDPFNRITPEELEPALDSAWFDCDGAEWTVNAEVAGRADGARAVVVRTEGDDDPVAYELPMVAGEMVEGALWQPFRGEVSDPAVPCRPHGIATVVEAHDASGALLDCVAFGADAAGLIAGDHDARLGAIARGDWSGCRVR